MQRLLNDDQGHVHALLGDLVTYHVSIDSVLAGHNPGAVYVDDPAAPQIILLFGPEGSYLGGAAPSAAQVAILREFVADLVRQYGIDELWLDCTSAWDGRLDELLPGAPTRLARQHYVCTALALDWRAQVPDGYAVLPITPELLARPDLDIPDHVHGWMRGNWGSTADFLAHGFGCVTIDEARTRLASWSLCDCAGGDACEIGIRTHPDYLRRGLAALTAAAAVDHALASGYRTVGWHCNADNIASRRTALKVGFMWERDYVHRIWRRVG